MPDTSTLNAVGSPWRTVTGDCRQAPSITGGNMPYNTHKICQILTNIAKIIAFVSYSHQDLVIRHMVAGNAMEHVFL